MTEDGSEMLEYDSGSDIGQGLPWVERNGFSHWALAMIWLVVGLIAFQLLASIVAVILILPQVDDLTDPNALVTALEQSINLTLIANSVGQFLVIGLASYLLSKLHAVKKGHHDFLRLRITPGLLKMTGLSVVLLVSSWGLVGLLGWINFEIFEWVMEQFPSLAFFKELQSQMAELITGFLKTDNSVWLGILYIAIVPAIFEEIMFRGYILRALEKSWGIWVAIIVSGFMFGIYHIQPSNILPLSFLGIVFAYVTYISGSLYPAIVLHFINNGTQVVYGSMNPEFLEQVEPTGPGMPWYLMILSILCFGIVSYLLFYLKKDHNEPLPTSTA